MSHWITVTKTMNIMLVLWQPTKLQCSSFFSTTILFFHTIQQGLISHASNAHDVDLKYRFKQEYNICKMFTMSLDKENLSFTMELIRLYYDQPLDLSTLRVITLNIFNWGLYKPFLKSAFPRKVPRIPTVIRYFPEIKTNRKIAQRRRRRNLKKMNKIQEKKFNLMFV